MKMWLMHMYNSLRTLIEKHMSNPEKIQVHGTKDGKLYIKPVDLFSQKKIQAFINRVSSSDAVKSIQKTPSIKP